MTDIGLDALVSATTVADTTPADDPRATVDAGGARAFMLRGNFIGNRDQADEDQLTDFLMADGHDAVVAWFGGLSRPLLHDLDALRTALDADIAAIDAMLNEQIDAILHHPRLRKIEGTWRGIAWLVDGVEQGAKLKVKILNIGWPEICRDLERAVEFDQSNLFRKIYEEEYGTPGGEPYGLIVVDHDVRHRPSPEARTDDVNALQLLCAVGAAAFCPIILGAAPALLEVDNFADLARVSNVTLPLRNPEHARWRTLTSRPDMRFIGIALPRLLARAPWEDDGTRADGFRYAEYVPTSEDRVWMSAGFAFAVVVARAFARYAWPADVRGVETDRIGGGLVDGVQVESFRTDPDHVWIRPATEIVWTDRQERELLDAGLMPLSALTYSEELVFGAVRSLLVPQRNFGATAGIADANARLSSQINSILCVSRFAHHLKMMGRHMVGAFKTSDEIQGGLQKWLTQYVNGNLNSSGETRARAPLVNGRIQVKEHPGKPGSFGCVVHLQPHYQLDDVAATFQLVTDLGVR